MHREYKPEVFTVGTAGPKGQRLFYFQSIEGDGIISLKCEKAHVLAIVDVLEILLSKMPPKTSIPLEELQAREPHDSILPWTIGELDIHYSTEKDWIELRISEFIALEDLEKNPDLENERQSITFLITREQADGFLRISHHLISMSRPLCELCSAPLNETPESNFCPCWN